MNDVILQSAIWIGAGVLLVLYLKTPPQSQAGAIGSAQSAAQLRKGTYGLWRQMTNAEELQASLLCSRNADGGWPFRHGLPGPSLRPSPCSPSVGNDSGDARPACRFVAGRATIVRRWLAPLRRRPTSTWVSSLSSSGLGPRARIGRPVASERVPWLSRHVCPEVPAIRRLRSK